jgi:ABC-2 type transport system permease protein
MYKFWIALKKEFSILIYDKTGLAIMYAMPILLVFIITIVQDSAFRIVNENRISMLIVNKDKQSQSLKLVDLMEASGLFDIHKADSLPVQDIKQYMLDEDYLTGLYIEPQFTGSLVAKATAVSTDMMLELGLLEDSLENNLAASSLQFYHDPVLKENYCMSVINMINAILKGVEGELLINTLCEQLGLEDAPAKLKEAMIDKSTPVERNVATTSNSNVIPNSTQHNVPAWTIFAMFFMVVSLGNNIVKERLNGSFIRLKTMPTPFYIVLASKMAVYLLVALTQIAFVFTLTKLTFPALDLPQLTLPDNTIGFLLLSVVSSLAAVSYALLIGSLAKTQQQSYGFGAVSIVIFAAIGGIWVPSFVMPGYLQMLSMVSPLNWCLQGFYVLFLKGGSWAELIPVLLGISSFVLLCLVVVYFKLKKEKII